MATAPIIDSTDEPEQTPPHVEILTAVDADPSCVLLGRYTVDQLVEAILVDIADHAHDPNTETGRKGIASDAFTVRKRKTAIDKTRLSMTAEWRRLTADANAIGKAITEKLDALADEIRAPVTAWEQAEEKRKAEANAIIADLEKAAIVTIGMTADDVEQQLDRIRGMNLNSDVLKVRTEMATDLQREAVEELTARLQQLRQQEAQARELEQLKRERAEFEARAEREAAERLAEQQRQEREKAEQERIAQAAQEAADRARREAEEAADKARRDAEEAAERKRQEEAAAARLLEDRRNYARQIIQHIKQVGLGMIGGQTYPYPILIRELEEKIAIDDSLGDMQEDVRAIRDLTLQNVKDAFERHMERKRTEEAEEQRRAEQRAREEAEAAAAEAQRKREADMAHRQQVIDAAVDAIAGENGIPGLTKKLATTIIHAIDAGKVPAVSITF